MHVYKCVYVDIMSAGVHVGMRISTCVDLWTCICTFVCVYMLGHINSVYACLLFTHVYVCV